MTYKPSHLHAFLQEKGLSPRRRFSQNFLIDGNILYKILTLASVKPGDSILEIGPGPGALTEALLAAGARVFAIEIDPGFAQNLPRLQTPDNRLTLFQEDALAFDLTRVPPCKVIANLPYHITTPLLAKFLPAYPQIESCTVMVQREVAHRFVAKPGTPDWSAFSLFLNFYSTPTYGFTVSKNCFFPKPKVDSAVVQLTLKEPPQVSSSERFFEMTRKAFGKRRKMLKTALQELYPKEQVESALLAIKRAPGVRAEELSLEEMVQLFECLQH